MLGQRFNLRHCRRVSTIPVTFITRDGRREVDKSMLHAAQENDIELEGACQGGCACSTCHVIVESAKDFQRLPEAKDEENDMLDLAPGLTPRSRLACQIIASPSISGIELLVPSVTRNFAVDGHVPKHH